MGCKRDLPGIQAVAMRGPLLWCNRRPVSRAYLLPLCFRVRIPMTWIGIRVGAGSLARSECVDEADGVAPCGFIPVA